jgi:alpha-mannosidase
MIRALQAASGLAAVVLCMTAFGQGPAKEAEPGDAPREGAPAAVDLTKPTLYVVGYAHLDTQWRWTYLDTIREYIPATMTQNYRLFEKYPNYVFNFSGSRRYEMMEEYYPEDYAKLQGYIDSGQWFPCGSSVDENDANVPSSESQIRHALYGNRYFRTKFGVASDEFMLPDCFGFPASLPTVLAHCGIRGFSTQKLTWGGVVPIPFKVGVWEGPDGSSVIAALDPGAYVGDVREDLSKSESWLQRINKNGEKSGVFADYHYYGTGDQGGAPKESSVAMVEKSVLNGMKDDAKIRVMSMRADAMFNAISDEQRAKLPRYKGELELTEHSAGSISSQAYMKRWNRKNELLADAAEKASTMAWWLGASDYPAARLEKAWGLVLGSQMHDILPGTSVPLAYDLSWNDEVIAANQFGAALTEGARGVISAMNTNVEGTPIVVFNPLSWERRDVVVAEVPYEGEAPTHARATNSDGKWINTQILNAKNGIARIAFRAKAPAMGFAVYGIELDPADIVNGTYGFDTISEKFTDRLNAADNGRTLENNRYTVTINDRGDVASIFDKGLKKELLSAPIRIGLFYENPANWPAWNQDWADRVKPARAYVGESGPVSIRVVENGPVRVSVEITREAEGSVFTTRVSLTEGGDRVEFDTTVDWNTKERSARVEFPLTASNPIATYDIAAGAIERPNSHEKQYEYPFHQWFNLTDKGGEFGASVMCDSKYACDKPSDNVVRLTLLFTPGVRGGYPDQATQDLGRHHIAYAIAGHASDWREAKTFANAARFNQPLVAFRAGKHEGALGSEVSLASVSEPSVSIQAMKKAEDSDEVIIRLREHTGQSVERVAVKAGDGIESAREVDGQERPIGGANVFAGELVTNIHGYGIRAFAVTLKKSTRGGSATNSTPIALAFDTDVISTNANRGDGAMTSVASYPAEQMPEVINVGGVAFNLGSGKSDGAPNAVTAKGQTIELPKGEFNRVYLLAASSEGDAVTHVSFRAGDAGAGDVAMTVPAWTGYVGQWDARQWPGDIFDPQYPWDSRQPIGLEPGYIKDGEIAWYVSHHHTTKPDKHDAKGAPKHGADALYRYCYVFRVAVDVPRGATSITLPDDARVKVFAVTAVNEAAAGTVAAAPLFDTLQGHEESSPKLTVVDGDAATDVHTDTVTVALTPGLYWREGSLRFTTDGNAPSAESPAYAGPLTLGATTTIQAGVVNPDGTMGPIGTFTVKVDDRTAPKVTAIRPGYESVRLTLNFSEPIAAFDPADVHIEPKIAAEGVELARDGRSAVITLASALKAGTPYTLTLANVRDASANANEAATAAHSFTVPSPVFARDVIERSAYGTTISDVPGLPTKAGDAFTINIFAKMDKQPTNRTILAGFGACADTVSGQGRYLAKFATGVHFWSHHQDTTGTEQYDLNRWQMITATSDGTTMRLYKDAKLIGERPASLTDDVSVVHIAPLDPWDKRYQFKGELAQLTIWNAALDEDSLKALLQASPQE